MDVIIYYFYRIWKRKELPLRRDQCSDPSSLPDICLDSREMIKTDSNSKIFTPKLSTASIIGCSVSLVLSRRADTQKKSTINLAIRAPRMLQNWAPITRMNSNRRSELGSMGQRNKGKNNMTWGKVNKILVQLDYRKRGLCWPTQ